MGTFNGDTGEIYLRSFNTHTLRLGSQLAARRLCITPLAHVVVVHVVEVSLSQSDEALKVVLVLGLHIGDSQASGSLLANHSTEPGLALHDAIWHTTRLAQAREPHNDLDRIDIMSDDNELRLPLLDECSDMVESHLHSSGLLRSTLTAAGHFLSLLSEAFLLLGLRLRLKIVEETEKLGSLTLVKSVAELVDCRWNLDALQERHLTALQANALGPFHEARQVTLGENIASDRERAWFLLHSRAWELDPWRRRLCHLLHHCQRSPC